MSARIAVIYYSATGNVHELAQALAEGAGSRGAEVRLRRVEELAPDSAIDANPVWRAHVDTTKDRVPQAELADLEWATAYAFGTPTRFGNASAQLKQFIDQTGGLWQSGAFVGKPVTSFTSAINRHGGQESTILSLNNVFYHWGCVIVPPGYSDPLLYAAGGNPYGTSWPSGGGEGPDRAALDAAAYQGRHLADIANRLAD
ncbi:NAD(P)H:quinone oxidoreductase [Streptomyces marincola]|uniref:NAD(P)H:quinone oxidoreductase, type IV n=1 Tax=Streptomyces marincola TaxID=2878388 RepID=A0A1W7CV29_9ACTN|nr:NAD(P)H:quinone oxidoreductase [Streptomyces marincola]ARQ68673.1 NAD(P)H:quinone oxidoreductase, type IV [Streptomyces marincola]